MRPIYILLALMLFLFSLHTVVAQDDSDRSFDVDSLFENPKDEVQEDDVPEEEEAEDEQPEPSVLDKLQNDDPLQMKGSVRFTGGYSPGWTKPLGRGGQYDAMPLVELSSSIDLLYAPSPVLSISQKFSFTYPDYDFELNELSIDYSFEEVAYLTLGLKKISWGRSPNFPFTNILQRQADSPLSAEDTQNTIISRLSIPLGIGGIELVAQNKDEYQENPASPQAERIGFGGKYNFAAQRIDIDAGFYYQKGLSGRAFVSGTTTLTDWLELYAEALVVDSQTRSDVTQSEQNEEIKDGWVEIAPGYELYNNNPDYGANLGMVLNLFSDTLDLNAEYYYNGEETEVKIAGARFPLFWGHNLALNAEYRVPQAPLLLQLGYRYNHTFRTSFLAPRIRIDLMRHTTFDILSGMMWGPEEAGYRAENPDDNDRPTFIAFIFTLHGKL